MALTSRYVPALVCLGLVAVACAKKQPAISVARRDEPSGGLKAGTPGSADPDDLYSAQIGPKRLREQGQETTAPTATPTLAATPAAAATATPTAAVSATTTPTASPTATPTATPTASPTASPTATPVDVTFAPNGMGAAPALASLSFLTAAAGKTVSFPVTFPAGVTAPTATCAVVSPATGPCPFTAFFNGTNLSITVPPATPAGSAAYDFTYAQPNAGYTSTIRVEIAVSSRVIFVSPAGDNSDGSTPAKAKQSIASVNALDLDPGDLVLFEGGATFDGELFLGPIDSGAAANPVTVSSFGSGRAVLRNTSNSSSAGNSVKVQNTAHVRLEGLSLRGAGIGTATQGSGVLLQAYPTSNYGADPAQAVSDVVVGNCDIQGHKAGIEFNWARSQDTIGGVTLRGLSLLDLTKEGIAVGSDDQNARNLTDVAVQDVRIDNVRGDGGQQGYGIALRRTDRATLDGVVITNAGGTTDDGPSATAGIGGLGLVLDNVRNVTVSRSVIARTRAAGGMAYVSRDDLGVGLYVQNSQAVRFERSHTFENRRTGVTLNGAAGAVSDVGLFFNIFDDDGFLAAGDRRASVLLYSFNNADIQDIVMAHNTLVRRTQAGHALGIYQRAQGVSVLNNVIVAKGAPLSLNLNLEASIEAGNANRLRFEGNLWQATTGTAVFAWSDYGNYATIAATAATISAFRSYGSIDNSNFEWNGIANLVLWGIPQFQGPVPPSGLAGVDVPFATALASYGVAHTTFDPAALAPVANPSAADLRNKTLGSTDILGNAYAPSSPVAGAVQAP